MASFWSLLRRPRLLPAAILALLAGVITQSCEVGPDYHRPQFPTPATYKSTTQPTTHPALGTNWWTIFNDPQLTQLEEAATKYNPDLQAAMQRVVEARNAAKAVKSQFYPLITLDPSLTRTTSGSSRAITGLGGAGGVAGVGKSSGSHTSTNYQIPFDLSYEVDLWGRIRRSYESSVAQAESSADAYFVLLQTLQADLAEDYFNLRSLDTQDLILKENVKLYIQQIDLTKLQQKAGLLGPTDVLQIQTLLDATRAMQIDARRQRADAEHAIAILTGRPPSELSLPTNPLLDAPPIIPAGLPSELLRRRPDVAQAEQNFIAASANIGANLANFYPKLTLTASTGLESVDLGTILSPQSRFSSIGPSLSIPIFEGGKLTAQLEQAKAQYYELYATYHSTILAALRDVEDSLNDLHYFADEAVAQERAVDAARETLRLFELQEKQAGLVSELQIIDTDRTLLTNQLTANQILNQRLTSTILLIKALGGGWQAQANTTQPHAPLTTLPDHSPTAPPTTLPPTLPIIPVPPATAPTTLP